MQIKDKIVVVTGAASGIGKALAHRFKKEGAKLVVCSDLNGEGVRRRPQRGRRHRLHHRCREGRRHQAPDRDGRSRTRPDRPVLLQCRHRLRRRCGSLQRALAADLGHQRDGACVGGAPSGAAHDRARRRLSAQHRLGRGPALAGRLGALCGDQARRGRRSPSGSAITHGETGSRSRCCARRRCARQ